MKKIDRLIHSASQILTMDDALGVIQHGAVAIDAGKIISVGDSDDLRSAYEAKEETDATGKVVTPGLVECHSHMVFAGSREEEYVQKLQGANYLEILESGGGILSTVKAVRESSHDDLIARAAQWLHDFLHQGITTVEIKTGYGLDYENEKKMLEVIAHLKKNVDMEIVPTFLGAHTFPAEHRDNPEKYVDEIVERMIPDFKDLAEFCDVFIEKGAFDKKQTERIMKAAKKTGYGLKLHTNQMNSLGGIDLVKKYQAVSADHLDVMSEKEIQTLAESGAVAVLIPGATYFLREEKLAPARELIDAGVPVAISTDFNPGSCPSPNLHMMMSFAVQYYGMLPEEVWLAVTLNAAQAIGREKELGSLSVGKKGHVVVWDMPNYLHPFYHFGVNFVEQVII